jgi:DNA-binding NarL/FixJ family response regulator
MKTRVLLVDDHMIIRQGLRTLMEKHDDLVVVAEAEDGAEAIREAAALRPDIVIIDISMPRINGVDATRRIIREHPDVRVIALSIHSERRFVVNMLSAGASAYLRKDFAAEELVAAIECVRAGKIFLGRFIAGPRAKNVLERDEISSFITASLLTPKEREVLQLIAEGKMSKEIAAQLKVSVKTIEKFRHQIMEKLDIHNIADLTKYAIREGLISFY